MAVRSGTGASPSIHPSRRTCAAFEGESVVKFHDLGQPPCRVSRVNVTDAVLGVIVVCLRNSLRPERRWIDFEANVPPDVRGRVEHESVERPPRDVRSFGEVRKPAEPADGLPAHDSHAHPSDRVRRLRARCNTGGYRPRTLGTFGHAEAEVIRENRRRSSDSVLGCLAGKGRPKERYAGPAVECGTVGSRFRQPWPTPQPIPEGPKRFTPFEPIDASGGLQRRWPAELMIESEDHSATGFGRALKERADLLCEERSTVVRALRRQEASRDASSVAAPQADVRLPPHVEAAAREHGVIPGRVVGALAHELVPLPP